MLWGLVEAAISVKGQKLIIFLSKSYLKPWVNGHAWRSVSQRPVKEKSRSRSWCPLPVNHQVLPILLPKYSLIHSTLQPQFKQLITSCHSPIKLPKCSHWQQAFYNQTLAYSTSLPHHPTNCTIQAKPSPYITWTHLASYLEHPINLALLKYY